MKQKCVRCVVQLSLNELHWRDANGASIHLEGPPVFVRACLLGQLQHSHLHKPLFPVRLNQELTFDRVLTNCRNPALFSEVIRGEHVRLEVIQVSSDYKGGKILARFDTSSNKFLFPDTPENGGQRSTGDGGTREVQLDKSRKYQHPPTLTFSTSTTLLEATIHSPIDAIFGRPGTSDTTTETDSSVKSTASRDTSFESLPEDPLLSGGAKTGSTSRKLFASSGRQGENLPADGLELPPRHHSAPVGEENGGTATQARLHSLLSSYTEPLRSDQDGREGESDVPDPRPLRVKFKPPVPKFAKPQAPAAQRVPVIGGESTVANPTSLDTSGKPYYKILSASVGPHGWEECPRRSPERRRRNRSSSAPNSPELDRHSKPKVSHRSRAFTLPNSVPLDVLDTEPLDPALAPRNPDSVPDTRPPFVVRHTDPKLLSRRDFCGSNRVTVARHYGATSSGRPPAPEELETAGGTPELREPLYRNETPSPRSGSTDTPLTTTTPLPQLHSSSSGYSDPSLPDTQGRYLNESSHVASSSSKLSASLKSASMGGAPGSSTRSYESHRSYRLLPKSSSLSFGFRSPPRARGSQRDVVSKYLLSRPGNRRLGVQSPSRLIEEKLRRVMEECCQCRHTSESLGEDSLSEDLDRLRASLAAEREEALNRSARLMPDKSVTVQIGPRDYWSHRMSEFTGKPHRILFDETLEKIYARLYETASQSH